LKNEKRWKRAHPEKGSGARGWTRITAEPDRLKKPPAGTNKNKTEVFRDHGIQSKIIARSTRAERLSILY